MNLKAWLAAHWFLTSLVLLVVLSAFLRFYKLSEVPHGMTWDEAAIGYDGFAVWTAHRDEWMHIMPISFRSFGDYKAPLAIYLVGAIEMILGMSLWVVRMPFAISGVLGVLGMVLLTRRLLGRIVPLSPSQTDLYGLLAGFALSLSPWDLHLTRIGMESGMALTLVIWGTYFLLRAIELTKITAVASRKQLLTRPGFNVLLAVGFLVASLYVYHSTKLATPLLMLVFAVWFRKTWLRLQKQIAGAMAVGGLLLVPLIIDSVFGHGANRLSQALLPTAGRTLGEIAGQLFGNLAIHFSLAFLVLGLTPVLRHGDGLWGVLFWPVFILALIGVGSLIYFLVTNRSVTHFSKLVIFGLIWIIIGYMPAVIGWEVPHANRTLLALPGWIWLALAGWNWLMVVADKYSLHAKLTGTHGETHLLAKSIVGVVILSTALFFIAYQHHYYTVFARTSASDFQDGYSEAIEAIKPYFYDEPGYPHINKIIFSDEYGQPYIFVLFNLKMSPILFSQGGINKIEFDEARYVNDGTRLRGKTIVVATQGNQMDWTKADKLIYGSDGQIRFGIFVNPHEDPAP